METIKSQENTQSLSEIKGSIAAEKLSQNRLLLAELQRIEAAMDEGIALSAVVETLSDHDEELVSRATWCNCLYRALLEHYYAQPRREIHPATMAGYIKLRSDLDHSLMKRYGWDEIRVQWLQAEIRNYLEEDLRQLLISCASMDQTAQAVFEILDLEKLEECGKIVWQILDKGHIDRRPLAERSQGLYFDDSLLRREDFKQLVSLIDISFQAAAAEEEERASSLNGLADQTA